jgi:hypothetical protein
MARQWLVLTSESAYKTKTSTPTINVDFINVRLDQSNAFTPRQTPIPWELRSADTDNERVLTGYERSAYTGRLSTVLYAVQAPFLLKWALTKVDQTPTPDLPWTTTEPAGDLGSVSADFAIEDPVAGTQAKLVYRGGKVLGGELTGSAESPLMRLTLDLAFSDTAASVLAEPAVTAYPTDPYVFQDLTGGSAIFKVGSTTTNFRSFSLRWQNNVIPAYDEFAVPQRMRLRGRTIDFETQLLYKTSTDRRTAFTGRTAQDCEFTFANGTNTAKIDLHARSFFSAVEDGLALDDEFTQTVTGQTYFDTATSSSVTLTFT